MLPEFFRHADTGILNPNENTDIILTFRRWLLMKRNFDGTALRRKFNRIGQEIQQYLIQPNTVTAHIFRRNIIDENIKFLLFLPNLGLYNADNAFHRLTQRNQFCIESHLSALNF